MMNKIEKIKEILNHQIECYKRSRILEADGIVDDSYVYDELIEDFSDLKRVDFVDLIEVLLSEDNSE